MQSITIPKRLNGPPGSGHGGATCGIAATAVTPGPAAVSLRLPPPMDVELLPVERDGAVEFLEGDRVVVRVTPVDAPDTEPMPMFDWDVVEQTSAAALEFVKPSHAFPTCFACGFARPEQDGLALYAGPIEGTPYLATTWVPGVQFASDGTTVDPWVVWAALDCPSGWATYPTLEPDETVVLGTLTAELREAIRPGERYQVVSRAAERDGRKIPATVAVVSADGTNVAVGEAMWITIPKPS